MLMQSGSQIFIPIFISNDDQVTEITTSIEPTFLIGAFSTTDIAQDDANNDDYQKNNGNDSYLPTTHVLEVFHTARRTLFLDRTCCTVRTLIGAVLHIGVGRTNLTTLRACAAHFFFAFVFVIEYDAFLVAHQASVLSEVCNLGMKKYRVPIVTSVIIDTMKSTLKTKYIDGSVQYCGISSLRRLYTYIYSSLSPSALPIVILQSCTKPSVYWYLSSTFIVTTCHFPSHPVYTCQGYRGYFREPHWNSMGLPETFRVTLTSMSVFYTTVPKAALCLNGTPDNITLTKYGIISLFKHWWLWFFVHLVKEYSPALFQ